MLKPTIKYAVFCGFFLVFLFFVSIWFGVNPLLLKQGLLFDVIIFLLFIYAANREFKLYHNGGFLHFWQGMSIGFIVYSLSIAIFLFAIAVFFILRVEFLDAYRQDLLAEAVREETRLIEEFGSDGYELIKENILSLSLNKVLFWSVSPPSVMFKKIFAGFLVTPVISIILRKKPE